MPEGHNIKAARYIVAATKNGRLVFTAPNLNRDGGINLTRAREFLKVWAALGWLTVSQVDPIAIVEYTITPAGILGLEALIKRYGTAP